MVEVAISFRKVEVFPCIRATFDASYPLDALKRVFCFCRSNRHLGVFDNHWNSVGCDIFSQNDCWIVYMPDCSLVGVTFLSHAVSQWDVVGRVVTAKFDSRVVGGEGHQHGEDISNTPMSGVMTNVQCLQYCYSSRPVSPQVTF